MTGELRLLACITGAAAVGFVVKKAGGTMLEACVLSAVLACLVVVIFDA